MQKLNNNTLQHSGRKGMKWGLHIFGKGKSTGGIFGRRARREKAETAKMVQKRRLEAERLREQEFINMYNNRQKMSTQAIRAKINRLEAENKFKTLVEAPGKARAEALKKKKQARLAFVGKVVSAGLDVYTKIPAEAMAKGLPKSEAEKRIKDFQRSQQWVKAIKDVPTNITKAPSIKQSVNIKGVDVYIPDTVMNTLKQGDSMGDYLNGVYIPSVEDQVLHYGKKGQKWRKKGPKDLVNDVINGVEGSINAIDDYYFDKDREGNLKRSIEDRKKDLKKTKKGGIIYNHPHDGKSNSDYKRAGIKDPKDAMPQRTKKGLQEELKRLADSRNRVKLPRLK